MMVILAHSTCTQTLNLLVNDNSLAYLGRKTSAVVPFIFVNYSNICDAPGS